MLRCKALTNERGGVIVGRRTKKWGENTALGALNRLML